MAETTALILTTLGASAGTAGAVGGFVGGAGSLLGGLGALSGIAGTVASLGSAGLSYGAGQAEAAALDVQARQMSIQAQSERLRGQAQGNQVRAALLRTLSAQNARYAASGLLTGEGTPQALADETRSQAELELGLIDSNAEMAALGREDQGAALRSRAKTSRQAGIGRAGLGLFDAADRFGARQPGRARAPAPAPGSIE